MAWSNLKNTWVAGDVLASSDLNGYANTLNTLANGVDGAVVATSESTSSASYVDLTTTTDTVTVTVGSSGKVLVMMYGFVTVASGGIPYMSYAVSGANTIAATDTKSSLYYSAGAGALYTLNGVFLETGLTAGSTTFKLKYRSSSGSQAFSNRRIAVIPFP
jgi:hypothetical protein